jgi:DNA-binding NtrC family response regulator
MAQRLQALLVYSDANPLESLNLALQKLQVDTRRAETCQEARRLIKQAKKSPDIIFSDATLPDGSWKQLLNVGGGLHVRPKVIVVARTEDPKFYIEAMEEGAFDFMLPPFESAGLAHVIGCATEYRARGAAAGTS